MAYEYEAIAALNRMLESKERREQTKLSHALAMMQFAQQQKMQDYSMAANQIAVLQQANEQMKISHASQFVADLGLEAFDLEDDDGLSAARKYLTKKIRYSKRTGVNKGGLGLTDVQANQLLSDVMAYRSGNASPILSTASDLSDIADKQSMKARGLDVKIGGEEHRLFSAFQTGLGYFDDVESATKKLGSIRQSLQNEEDIIRDEDGTIKENNSFSFDTDINSQFRLIPGAFPEEDISVIYEEEKRKDSQDLRNPYQIEKYDDY